MAACRHATGTSDDTIPDLWDAVAGLVLSSLEATPSFLVGNSHVDYEASERLPWVLGLPHAGIDEYYDDADFTRWIASCQTLDKPSLALANGSLSNVGSENGQIHPTQAIEITAGHFGAEARFKIFPHKKERVARKCLWSIIPQNELKYLCSVLGCVLIVSYGTLTPGIFFPVPCLYSTVDEAKAAVARLVLYPGHLEEDLSVEQSIFDTCPHTIGKVAYIDRHLGDLNVACSSRGYSTPTWEVKTLATGNCAYPLFLSC